MKNVMDLIEATANTILDEWTAEAVQKGQNVEDYIGDKLDSADQEIADVVGKAWLRRLFNR